MRQALERLYGRIARGCGGEAGRHLVLYSKAVGSVVNTSRNDRSPLVTELLKEMRAPGVTAEQVLRNTQDRAVLGDLQAALKDCDMALQFDPGLVVALDSRGLVNLKLGNNADAIRDYSRSIEKNPRSVSSLFGRSVAL